MNRAFRFTFTSLVAIAVSSAFMYGQNSGSAVGRAAPTGSASIQSQIGSAAPATGGVGFAPFVQPYYYPTFSWFGAYASPFLYLPTPPPAHSYLPNYWWLGGYPSEDPRQEGYNPQAGYPADTVTTLLLVTFPAKARVTLDGVFVGTSDFLGPIQLPVGEHSLRVEAAGYEPSEKVLKVEHPDLQQLEVRLKPSARNGKPGPRA